MPRFALAIRPRWRRRRRFGHLHHRWRGPRHRLQGGLKNNLASLSVTGIAGALSYDANTDPDPDGNGTTISVAKP